MVVLQLIFVVMTFRCLQIISCDEEEQPIIQTNIGKLRGSVITNDGGLEFYAFRGIPFAKPPVKELRFKDPQALHDEEWPGVLDATEDGSVCIQYNLFNKALSGDEDCLYLNVYMPKVEAQQFAALLPVMVYIHGGGFASGSGVSSFHGPQRIMSKLGIVLVSINYRLGPFGFFTTLDENSPGNYGLMDQVMALKWVRDNIAAFGGDSNQVTIFGNSAGSASVGFHMLSPLSKGLFHAVITQSGSVLSEWATHFDQNTAVNNSKELAELLRCPTDCNKAMMKCLMRLPSLDIIMKTVQLNNKRINQFPDLVFKPVVDQVSRRENAYLPDTPQNLIANRRFHVVPIMSGVNQDEGILFMEGCMETSDEHGRQVSEEKLPICLKTYLPSLFRNEEQWKRTTEKIISSYFENVDEKNITQKLEAVEDMISDGFITYAVDVQNELFAKFDVPVFVYKFTHRGENSVADDFANDMVAHVDELQYLFRSPLFKSMKLSEEDARMSDLMLTLWTNFAKTKVPSFVGSASHHPELKWEPLTSNKYKYLELNLTPAMVDGYLSLNYNLWRTTYSIDRSKDEL